MVLDGLNNVEVYSKLSITGSLAFRNSDDSEIVDANNNVELRQVNSNGDLVASRAVLSSDKQTFTIIPDQMLSTNSTYWYGIKDNTTNYAGGASVSGVSGTFSTSSSAPEFAIYDDNESGHCRIFSQGYNG